MNLTESVKIFTQDKKAYYKQWIFDQPVVLSQKHNEKMQRLQKILGRLITHFVTHYNEYRHLMPLSERAEQVIQLHEDKPYKIGTYRTDFVYDKNNQVRLLEITCRFALNGMFLSAVMNDLGNDLKSKNQFDVQTQDLYTPILDHMLELIGDADKVIVLKGADRRNESKLFTPIFERSGLPVKVLELEQIASSISLFSNSFIVSELGLEEILSLSEVSVQALIDSNLINDFRTIFLVHDKRFFSILYNESFRKAVLSLEEETFFQSFLVPTYNYGIEQTIWEAARQDKDSWVIKHATLGKSQQVHAGVVTSEEEWEALFQTDMSQMVLQKWVDTERVKGSIDDQNYNDYLTGTLIFFDDHYFGLGDFRTSSFPVTNKTDHRKACTFVLKGKMNSYIPNLKYLGI